MTQDTDTW